MCVAIPGIVKEVLEKENMAVIDFNGNVVRARTGLVKVKPGDYALVHAGCVIQVMQSNEAEEMIELFEEMKL